MPFPIVGIGASAGGLEALSELLTGLPPSSGMAFLLVQHLDPHHDSLLPALLAAKTLLPVQEAREGLVVKPDHIYVIPPNTILTLVQDHLTLAPRDEQAAPPRPIDCLFRSLAEGQGSNAIGVILSGTGSDGALGLRAIKQAGGLTYAQDQSAKFSGMPKAAVEHGAVDRVLPPAAIAQELARLGGHPYLANHTPATTADSPNDNERLLHRVFNRLREICGVDFTHYKRGTIQRRLSRRLAIHGIDSLPDYVNRLEGDPEETQALFQDLLIQVTDFFRDPELFKELPETVFPRLLENRSPQDPLRIWVPGCASGEEVYSLAICLLEYLGDRLTQIPIQIFGTDLGEATIEKARAGLYPEDISKQVSEERLRRFFVKVDGHYRISHTIRDLCVFARHNVVNDPPFSRLDLISCRNVLIYLDPVLQKQVIPIFHYALVTRGFLLLGPSETIGACSELFSPFDKRLKIYAKAILPGQDRATLLENYPVLMNPRVRPKKLTLPSEPGEAERLQQEADRVVIAHYVPPGILCDEDLNILQFRGETSPYLANPSGPPTLKLQKLARPGLLVDLSSAITQAAKKNIPVRREDVRVTGPGGVQTVNLQVIPLRLTPGDRQWFLVFFEEPTAPLPVQTTPGELWYTFKNALGLGRDKAQPRDIDHQLRQCMRDLEAARDYIRSTLEAHEAAVEELKATEEELLSSNEEFQSTNEELETAQEELQSSNDELRARNRELNGLNDRLEQARNYAEAIVAALHHPLLVLDGHLYVQQANPAFYHHFRTTPDTTEHRLLYELNGGQWATPGLRQLLEEILPTNTAFHNKEVTLVLPDLGERIMCLNAQVLRWDDQERILLAIEDVTEHKATLAALKMVDRRKDEFLAMLAHELRNPLAPIRNALEIWRRGNAGEAIERRAQAMLDRQLRLEARLLDDLLDLSRITRGTIVLQKQQVDLAQIVAHTVHDAESQLTAHRHHLDLHLPEHGLAVEGDPARLQQIVANLLTNAIKYTPAEGSITLTLSRESQEAVFTIADTGIGIGSELLPVIFDLFVQSDKSLDRAEGGLGIGLTLVRRLTELHGGRIEAHSAGLGHGSKFTFRLPALADTGEPMPTANAGTTLAVSTASQRILVVDDNQDAAESTAILLRFEGHEVRTAFDGPSALTLAQAFRPQVVLIDIGLPGLDGYEVARRLRELPELENPFLVAITGYGQSEDRDQSREAGFDEHWVKPVALDRLKTMAAIGPNRAPPAQATYNSTEQ